MNFYCSNLLDTRNLHEQVKNAFCCQKWFWPFTFWINCFSDLKKFANSRPSALNFKFFSTTKTICSHSRSEQFWQQNTIYSYFQIQDLICFCHQNFIILLNSHKPILIVHASALLYITPDYMKPAEMISMSLFRNWIKTGKKIEAKKMMKEWEKAGPEL